MSDPDRPAVKDVARTIAVIAAALATAATVAYGVSQPKGPAESNKGTVTVDPNKPYPSDAAERAARLLVAARSTCRIVAVEAGKDAGPDGHDSLDVRIQTTLNPDPKVTAALEMYGNTINGVSNPHASRVQWTTWQTHVETSDGLSVNAPREQIPDAMQAPGHLPLYPVDVHTTGERIRVSLTTVTSSTVETDNDKFWKKSYDRTDHVKEAKGVIDCGEIIQTGTNSPVADGWVVYKQGSIAQLPPTESTYDEHYECDESDGGIACTDVNLP